jgi:hypothetical protein
LLLLLLLSVVVLLCFVDYLQMSELEEHYLLRVPEPIAEQLRAMIRDRKMPTHGVSFHLQSTQVKATGLIQTHIEKKKKKKKKSLLNLHRA